jgi:hypothetical protein
LIIYYVKEAVEISGQVIQKLRQKYTTAEELDFGQKQKKLRGP